jgi:AcrR family transcriptional regulator
MSPADAADTVNRRRPGRPTAGNSPATDDEMLEAALGSFAELGYEGTSVRDLCRRLGVSHSLIHQRFGSKDELWYAAVDHGFKSLLVQMMQAVVDMGAGDDLDRLRAVLVRFVEVTAASPSLIGVINQEGLKDGPRIRYIHEMYIDQAMQLVSDVLDRLEAAERVRPVPQSVFYFLMANGATGPLTLPGLAGCFPDAPAAKRAAQLRRYAESVVDFLFDGFVIR